MAEDYAQRIVELEEEVARLKAALNLLGALASKRTTHLGRYRLSGIEQHCEECITGLALRLGVDDAETEHFTAALRALFPAPSSDAGGTG